MLKFHAVAAVAGSRVFTQADDGAGGGGGGDPAGCKRPVGYFHYEVCFPETDACGGDLTKIEGAWIEVLDPGSCEYRRDQFVTFPNRHAKIAAYRDGQYAVRHVVVGACSESDPSEATPVSIDLTPPAKPPMGHVMIPCPQ